MSKQLPWDDIKTPSTDYNVRLAPDSGPVRVFWGRDVSDRRLLVVELEGDNSSAFQRGRVHVQGITVELRQAELPSHQSLVFRLQRNIDQDLFLSFCSALIATLQQATSGSAAVHIALAHLRRWKTFLSSGRTHGLSPEEVRGLFGELDFLQSLSTKLLPVSAVEAWCGPLGGQQDFVFGDTAVEVKTLFGPNRNAVRVSSEDQLDGVCGRLLLAVLRVVDTSDHTDSMSLNAKVCQVAAALGDAGAEEKLWVRLGSAGYVNISDYESPEFLITSRRYFAVAPTFPRLIRAEIPVGIVRVSYDVQLDSIGPFEVNQGAVWSHS